MSSAFVKVIRVGPDLPPKAPEPYIRINTFALDDLGLPETELEAGGPRLQAGAALFNANWELYTAEPDAGPIMRLSQQGLNLTGLKAGRTYVATYDPDARVVRVVRPLSGK